MNVLLVSTSEMTGGAAIAARRLLFALNRYGESHGGAVQAKLLVRDRATDCPDVIALKTGKFDKKFRFAFERGVIWLNNHFSKENLFQVSIADTGYDITSLEEFREADVIHLHWTQQGMLSLHDLDKIFKSGKKVVWTMHDMWACTGICHYSDSCLKYRDKCQSCPMLKNASQHDLADRVFQTKQKIYQKYSFQIITCSEWLKDVASSSHLLKGKEIVCLSNPVDSAVFHSADRTQIRKELELPADRKLVLFASQKITDKRKGLEYLIRASHILKDKGMDLAFVVMGNSTMELDKILDFPLYSTGYVSSEEKTARIYQAVDLFVSPSLMDNLPNTIAESMSCGTPCVGFDIGGIPEMIDHKVNGYVAKYKNAEDLANGIEWVLSCGNLENKCLTKAHQMFDEDEIARQIISVYQRS